MVKRGERNANDKISLKAYLIAQYGTTVQQRMSSASKFEHIDYIVWICITYQANAPQAIVIIT